MSNNTTVKIRTSIPTAGSFVSIPDAFPNLDGSIKHAMKLEFTTVFSKDNRVQAEFSTDKALIDFAAIDASALDPETIARDCDLVKTIALQHPKELQEMILAMQSGGMEGIEKAEAITQRIGLTEQHMSKLGGGLFWLIIPLIAIAVGGCATTGSNKPFKQSTFPRPRQH